MKFSNEYQKRLESLYSINIQNPIEERLHEVWDDLRIQRNCVKYPSEIQHALVLSLSGVCKTHQAVIYKEKNPPMKGEEFTKIPVAYCEVPHPFSLDKFYFSLLESIETEYIGRSWNEKVLRQQAILQLKNNQTELLFLDEFQHVLSMDSNRVKIMDTIKSIANGAGVCLVCLAKPDAATLRTDMQVFRRFEVYPIDRFTDYNSEAYLDMLGKLEDALNLKMKTNLADSNSRLPKLIHKMTKGIMYYMKKLLIQSAKIAIKNNLSGEGPEKITPAILKEAYKTSLIEFAETMEQQIKVDEKYIRTFLERAKSGDRTKEN